jgi:hypothetical protein
MKGKWRLFMQYINGAPHYIVGRQRFMDEPLHSGNIEYPEGATYTENEKEAEELRDRLNTQEA